MSFGLKEELVVIIWFFLMALGNAKIIFRMYSDSYHIIGNKVCVALKLYLWGGSYELPSME